MPPRVDEPARAQHEQHDGDRRRRRRWRSGGRRPAAAPRPARPRRAGGPAPSRRPRRPVRSPAAATGGRGDVCWGPSDPSFPVGTTMVVPPELGLPSGATPVSSPQTPSRGPGRCSSPGMKPGSGGSFLRTIHGRGPRAYGRACQAFGRREEAGVFRPEHAAHLASPVDRAARPASAGAPSRSGPRRRLPAGLEVVERPRHVLGGEREEQGGHRVRARLGVAPRPPRASAAGSRGRP